MTIRLLAAAASLVAALPLFAQKPKKAPKPAAPSAVVQPYNRFITVDEYHRAKRRPASLISIEGYAVLGYRLTDGTVRLALVDSVDHVLSAEDANKFAASGAFCSVRPAQVKKNPKLAFPGKHLKELVMYTGPGIAKKCLHDVVDKLRVTGAVSKVRATLDPVTRVEFMDDNGDWKAL
jgi:hypothetical protein